jgi:hypothetical protein
MPLRGHVRVKTAGEGPGLLVVYLDWTGGRGSVSRVAADEQKTELALEFRDESEQLQKWTGSANGASGIWP